MRGWHLIPIAIVAFFVVALPVAALTHTGLERDLRKELGFGTGECEPETDLASSWRTAQSLPYPIDEPRASTLDGQIYLVGGITDLSQESNGRLLLEPSAELTRFDPKTENFTSLTPLPLPI